MSAPRAGAGRARVRAVRVEARAKLNLGLAVGPRRRDGFHDLATVFQSISLADTLVVSPRRRGFTLAVSGESGAAVPRGAENLVLRAARLMEEAFGVPGAAFRLVKRIPAGAGLGGGSADAAAALVGLARLYRLRLPRARRLELAARLGSDVPFMCLGGTALGLGRGERLRSLRLARPFWALLAIPPWRISTASAFRRIDAGKYGLTRWKANLRFAQALGRDGVTATRANRLGNTFEFALGSRRASFESLCERLVAAGVKAPRLTGSGSAVFGVLPAGASREGVAGRFEGSERLHVVRSTRSGLRVAVAK